MSRLLFMLSLLAMCSCAHKSLKDHKGSYLESAKLNFAAGEKALKEEDFEKAISYFQFVRSKYPFSQYAALSDLNMAHTRFAQKKWLEAASAYQIFIRLHPRHIETSLASYRMALSYFYAIPDDFFLLPSSDARDQSYTKEALEMFNNFIASYPTSEYIKEAYLKRQELLAKLARHNMMIASYYLKRHRYEAALKRLLAIRDLYGDTNECVEALLLAARILVENIKDKEQAKEIYLHIVNEYKASPLLKEAETRLAELMKDFD